MIEKPCIAPQTEDLSGWKKASERAELSRADKNFHVEVGKKREITY